MARIKQQALPAQDALGRQWYPARTPEDLAAQAARVRANNARATRLPMATERELRLEKLRADTDS